MWPYESSPTRQQAAAELISVGVVLPHRFQVRKLGSTAAPFHGAAIFFKWYIFFLLLVVDLRRQHIKC